MATVALQMIVKNELEEVLAILKQAHFYFDQINLTVSNKMTADKLKRHGMEISPKINVKWREWTDDFAAARNANFAMSTCDYNFWLDSDDEFDFKNIPKMVDLAEANGYVVLYMPYNYAQDEDGRCIALHWRERLVKRSHPFEWRGRVHETLISDEPYKSSRVKQQIIHHGHTHHKESVDRNHEILLKATQETDDPRYLHYLGLSYFTRGEHSDAIKTLEKFNDLSGWDEEIYRSLNTMAESAYALKQFGRARHYALQAAGMFPSYPMAYWLLEQFEADQDNFEEAFEWAKVAKSKPIPQSMSIVDPTNVSRSIFVGARSAYMMGDFSTAWKWIQEIPDEPLAQELWDDFRAAAEKEVFVKLLPTLRPYFNSDEQLWSSLIDEVKYDGRVSELRNLANPPRKWGSKSIVFFCGQGYEPWGPDTLDKGMGGSEEAIVYLSREMAKLGWDVTVYNERDDAYLDQVEGTRRIDGNKKTVVYLPWRYLDKRDTFNVLVCWRSPAFADALNAKVKLVDMHDIAPVEAVKPYKDVTYMFKSQFHKDLYPVEDYKIIGNGNITAKEHTSANI